MDNPEEAKRVLEAALLASQEPLQVQELKRLFDQELGVDVLRKLLEELREEWSGRSVELSTWRAAGGSRRARRSSRTSSACCRKSRRATRVP
jgi:segregation and condensation protein B